MKKLSFIFIFLMFIACSSSQKKAETQSGTKLNDFKTGSIAGCVYQQSKPISQVEISIQEVNLTKEKQTVLSSENGFFQFTSTEPAGYDLIAIKDGYKKLLIKSIPVKAGQVSFVKIHLRNLFTDVMQPPQHWEDAGVIFIPYEEFENKKDLCD